MSATSRLIHKKEVSPYQKVTVWREESQQADGRLVLFRKSWQCDAPKQADAWLSWARHEHFLLSLLAGRGAQHAVIVSDLHVDQNHIELVTRDAGPELQRDWLSQPSPSFQSERDLLSLTQHCLFALQEIHRMGIVHGDFKADNLCIPTQHERRIPDLSRLQLIDFAFSLSRDYPLRFVLPIDPDRIDYLPNFYKKAIRQAQANQNPELIQKVCCAEIDLFSLGVMIEKIMKALALQGSEAWPNILRVVGRCKEVGDNRPNAIQRWLRKDFAQPTNDMLRIVKQALESLPAQEKSQSAESTGLNTPFENSETRLDKPLDTPLGTPLETPIATPLKTPLPPPVMTPLATPLVAPIDHQKISANRPDSTPNKDTPQPQKRWRWLAISALLVYLYFRIDLIYKREGLIITDMGYYLALSAMVLSPLLVWSTLHNLRLHNRLAQRIFWVVTGWMTLAASYFLITLSAQGLSWYECLFL